MSVPARRRVTAALLAMPFARPWLPATAAQFQSHVQPLHLLVGYAAGGGADHVARIVADSLGGDGEPVIVDNRPGASGQIAMHEAARAGTDRQTLLLGTVGSVSIGPLLAGSPEAPARQLQPLAIVASTPHVLLMAGDGTRTRPDQARATLQRLLDDARVRPGEIAYASLGIHSSAHLVGELMCRQAGVSMAHVPYPGSARALVDLQGGHVALLVSTLQAALPLMRQGRVRALAVTGRARSPLAPMVPTFSEAGIAGMPQEAWYGVLASPGVPETRRVTLFMRLTRLLREPSLRQRLAQDGAEPLSLTGQQAIDYLEQQREVWRQALVAVSGRLG
ncbi:Bug family tripartite tricarboxylate transporter substrate binding protein [Cupriavidus pauculus]|uniref:ABC transporter substrate-binding protein n=1 Tax=Cupriavidus pauculus TaxID=82633 RepID=A0A2N5C315_9BURK|nr:tripartite tricarboxylate transporter substrate binding protein [Cupriavidus pauculus]PLP96612.1 ABC transporter substrate-binding protein [Cupriavidus pauculus]